MKALALLFLAVVPVAARPLDVRTETKAEQQKALDELSHFCDAMQFTDGRPILRIAAHEDSDVKKPWDVRIYIVDGTHFITWEETGYPRLMWAVKSAEEDFQRFDYGYSGQYGQEKPGYCGNGVEYRTGQKIGDSSVAMKCA